MSDTQMIVTSAVVLPETDNTAEPSSTRSSPLTSSKRRRSEDEDERSKRPRLSTERTGSKDEVATEGEEVRARRRASGAVEEKKRGKRLFGALLGTLAQSSSSTAQKRRASIEKKQREKLRQQAEEDDEKKKQTLEKLLESRRTEQWKWDKQSMSFRHSNALAMAKYLQTKSEPKLYYKPWQLEPEDEDRIKLQVEEAERIIEREVEALDRKQREENSQPNHNPVVESQHITVDSTHTEEAQAVDKVRTDADETAATDGQGDAQTNGDSVPASEYVSRSTERTEQTKDHHMDDVGDVLEEGDEDNVIY